MPGIKRDRERSVMHEINVTPLVDVMLVLLIIFMVTAPLLQQGIDVNLPKAKGKELTVEKSIFLTVKGDGTLFLNDQEITQEELKKRLFFLATKDPEIFLRADSSVPYGLIATIIGDVKDAGIERLGLVTEPLAGSGIEERSTEKQ